MNTLHVYHLFLEKGVTQGTTQATMICIYIPIDIVCATCRHLNMLHCKGKTSDSASGAAGKLHHFLDLRFYEECQDLAYTASHKFLVSV